MLTIWPLEPFPDDELRTRTIAFFKIPVAGDMAMPELPTTGPHQTDRSLDLQNAAALTRVRSRERSARAALEDLSNNIK